MYCLTDTEHLAGWMLVIRSVFDWVDAADELDDEHETRRCESALFDGIAGDGEDQLSSSTKTLFGSEWTPGRCFAEFI